IVLSDFARIVVYDLDDNTDEPADDFPTAKLHEHISSLMFLTGQTQRRIDPEDPINIEAVEVLGRLHDALEESGYTGHPLERLLVRILFCCFADDTGIFPPDIFKRIVDESRENGFGLGGILQQMFEVLDTHTDDRPTNLPEEFSDLPYVNGQLFAERLPTVNFGPETRAALLEACEFNWSRISPAVFGSLFQSIMDARSRRQIGAHYTSERDILKLINSLFLDDLKAELEKTTTKPKLLEFQNKLASLTFLDPACGCGNFLVIAYRELRRLEIETLKRYHAKRKGEVQRLLNISSLLKVEVDQMHGIEIEEWPARIAEVAMWLMDHQMNTEVGEVFGEPVVRLPLKKSAKIVHGNALRLDWNEVLPAYRCSYVLGNPPFVGKKEQNAEQKADFRSIWGKVKGSGVLDFVTCWHKIASAYISKSNASVAFVSTNSICQGEQVGILWPEILDRHKHIIQFAHTTFPWTSEARGKAHVHVVIIGFGPPRQDRIIWDYSENPDTPAMAKASNISPYLTDSPNIYITNRTRPISNCPSLSYGSFALDDGHFTLSPEEADQLVSLGETYASVVRRFIGAKELIRGEDRYCIWLKDTKPSELRAMPEILERVNAVRDWRRSRDRATTVRLAETPTLFAENRQPKTDYFAIPTVSSENRDY
ncbi:MAG: DNA methyltransferase, partial [Phycisphaerales bacterium]